MKYRKIMFASTFILSIALLTGCVGTEKEAPEKEETPVIQKETTEKEEPAVIEEKKVEVIEGFKQIGNDLNGYIQVPEEFLTFKEIDNPTSPATQYASEDQSFIVTYLTIDETLSFEEAVQSLKDSMGMGGPEFKETKVTAAGLEGIELYQEFDEEGFEGYQFHVYVLKGKKANRYIAIEYYGDGTEIKDQILNSYLEEKPVK